MTERQKKTGWKKGALAIRIAVAVAACLLVAKQLNWPELKAVFANLHLWTLLVGIIAFTFSQCVVGFRWWLLLVAQNMEVSLWKATKLNFLGLFYSNFLPGSMGGDVVRAWQVSRLSERRLQAAIGVIVDRLLGLVSTLTLAVVSYFLFVRGRSDFALERSGGLFGFVGGVSAIDLTLVVLIAIGVLLVIKKPLNTLLSRLGSLVFLVLGQLQQVVAAYYRHPFVLIGGVSLTLCIQCLVIWAYWLIGQDLGIAAPLGLYLCFFPLVWLAGAIPISVAGIGILEGGLVFLFVRYGGASPEAAAALALCQRLTWLVATLPGLVVHLCGDDRYRPKELTRP